MKKIIMFVSILTLVTIISACGATDKTIVETDSMIVKYDKNQLVNDADVIVRATILSQEVQVDFEGYPATDTILEVSTVYKGNPGKTVEVRLSGGESDDMILIPDEHESPELKVGKEVVLFLTNNKGNRPDKEDFQYYIVGAYQGKFETENDGTLKNEKFSFNDKNFLDELKEIEIENKNNNLQKIFLKEGEESGI